MKVVLSFGGSVLAPDEFDKAFAGELASFLDGQRRSHLICVVVGGGATARKKIAEARKKGSNNFQLDMVGIEGTRENARALLEVLGDAAVQEIPESVSEAASLAKKGSILVMGGTGPGHSTDAVAALLAEAVDADLLVNASNVKGVYDKDPNEHEDARLLPTMTHQQLVELVQSKPMGAGEYALVDLLAAKVLERSSIKAVFVDGRNLRNIEAVLKQSEFEGTTVGG